MLVSHVNQQKLRDLPQTCFTTLRFHSITPASTSRRIFVCANLFPLSYLANQPKRASTPNNTISDKSKHEHYKIQSIIRSRPPQEPAYRNTSMAESTTLTSKEMALIFLYVKHSESVKVCAHNAHPLLSSTNHYYYRSIGLVRTLARSHRAY